MKKLLLFVALISILACDQEKKEDLAENVNKEGAIETELSVEHLDDQYDILTTTYRIWSKNMLTKTIVKRDTLPALGEFEADAADNDGNESKVKVKKDYEFYITVK
jgi:Frog skin active peptide family signal and propeptide